MQNEELYPELIDYIFGHCGKYFWQSEIKAHMHLHAMAKSNNGGNVVMYKFFLKDKNVLDNKEIKDLVNGGFKAFKVKVVERIEFVSEM